MLCRKHGRIYLRQWFLDIVVERRSTMISKTVALEFIRRCFVESMVEKYDPAL